MVKYSVLRKSGSGADSGVTLHKLSEQFDAGDILLQEKIKIEQEDHLVTLLEKIKKVFVKLLSEYLSSPDEIWDYAEHRERANTGKSREI